MFFYCLSDTGHGSHRSRQRPRIFTAKNFPRTRRFSMTLKRHCAHPSTSHLRGWRRGAGPRSSWRRSSCCRRRRRVASAATIRSRASASIPTAFSKGRERTGLLASPNKTPPRVFPVESFCTVRVRSWYPLQYFSHGRVDHHHGERCWKNKEET